jgi:class 3 adenylate cyclase
VSIAYWEIGKGKPVVVIQNFSISHAELEWTVPSMSSFYLAMAERYRLIRFDPRGIGLSSDPPGGWGTLTSEGDQVGMSTEEMVVDIEAVAEALGLDSFALMALQVQGPVAVTFAAMHPERVSELILCQSAPNNADNYGATALRTHSQIKAVEEETGEDLPYPDVWSWLAPDGGPELGNLISSATSRINWTANPVASQWNARHRLGDVDAPTLLLCPRNWPETPRDRMLADSRELAAGIPVSHMRVVDGTYVPYFADHEAVLHAIDDLLKPDHIPERPSSGFRTVVITDIVDSTTFMSEVGDEEAREAIRAVEDRVAYLADRHGGRVVKNLGDGSLLSFGSNTAALRFALELQSQTDPDSPQLRIGMAAGEPIEEDGDIHGAVVAYASRVADLGGAGEIIASDSVRQLAMGKGFNFTPMGQHELKGFDEPATVWKVTAPDGG